MWRGKQRIEASPSKGAGKSPTIKEPQMIEPHRLGLRILYVPPSYKVGDPAGVDVVAVHGIGADPDHTWETAGVNWLSDSQMLQQAIPKSRIMRFGYDSQWFGPNIIKERLSKLAEKLLYALVEEREGFESRPLVFIGHCFGGIVIEKAITSSMIQKDRFPGILASTAGVIFLGTPHRGTDSISSQGAVYAAIASNTTRDTDNSLLRALSSDDQTLMDAFGEFNAICTSRPTAFPVSCFYEQKSTFVGRIIGDPELKEFMVDERSASMDHFPSQGLGVDHFNLNKFASPEDSHYKAIRREIRKIVQLVPATFFDRSQYHAPGIEISNASASQTLIRGTERRAPNTNEKGTKTSQKASENISGLYRPYKQGYCILLEDESMCIMCANCRREASPECSFAFEKWFIPSYRTGQQVFYRGKFGDPQGDKQRFWLCCIKYMKRTREIFYNLKKGPDERGNDETWVEEHDLCLCGTQF